MGFWFLLFPLLYALPEISAQQPLDVTIKVTGNSTISETDDNFVCATLDWWPPEKCNYNQCPWGESSVLNLDISHPFLARAIQAFNPLRIRVGGSLQDQVIYGVKSFLYLCLPFKKMPGGLFGFSKGCLSMERWDELNNLFKKTGAIVTFGLNALMGRHHVRKNAWGGPWNLTNARDFIEYTISKGYQKIDSWEFGNELSGHGIGARVDAEVYGKDLVGLKALLNELYKNSPLRTLLLAPGGFFEKQWYSQFLQVSGSSVVNAVTHHIYNLGGGERSPSTKKILDPQYLSRVSETYKDLQHTIQIHGPWASAWVGEAGGAFNNGGDLVSNTFINSFWYLDQIGMASKFKTMVFCRQTLVGGNYGLLDTETFIPNPDYYSGLLWHRLMGKGVLSVDTNASSYLRAYAHCSKQKGGVSLLLINLSNRTEFRVNIVNGINGNLHLGDDNKEAGSLFKALKRTMSWVGRKASDGLKREEYHLTAKDGYHRSKTMLLNRNPLELTQDGGIPAVDPLFISIKSPIFVAPMSIAFVVLPNFEASACA